MKNTKAFTLIELLVVVLIIGILAAVALPQYQRAVNKARYTQAIILVENIMRAEQRYRLANGNYTLNFDELDMDMPTPTTINGGYYHYNWGYCWLHQTYVGCLVHLGSSAQNAAYVNDYSPLSKECWAYPKGNARANAFCQYMTKKSTGYDNGTFIEYHF